MNCERCGRAVEPEEVREYAGQKLCEDCYMDALSPARTCDPWATYTASRLGDQQLNPNQEKILALIKEKGEVSMAELTQATSLSEKDVERELAALRHMELVRATPGPGGEKLYTLMNR